MSLFACKVDSGGMVAGVCFFFFFPLSFLRALLPVEGRGFVGWQFIETTL